jgi:hypothetical protein
MPRLITFVACRRTSVDEHDQTVTLTSLFDRVTIQVLPGVEVPSDLFAPIDWCAFSWWAIEPEDRQSKYKQRVVIVSPTGEERAIQDNALNVTQERHRLSLRAPAFPVHTAGIYQLKLLLRQDEEEWQDVATYFITVEHNAAEVEEEQQEE